jgi:type I restriction enzyme R subunit
MSELLDELVKRRKQEDIAYKEYLQQIVELTKQARDPEQSVHYLDTINSKAKQALYDNLGQDEQKALLTHEAVLSSRHDGFRGNPIKERAIKIAIKKALPELSDDELIEIFEIIKNQDEY